ncbi:MAG: NAD-dependent epimerase/dehydratase family protein [Rudaea sp.]
MVAPRALVTGRSGFTGRYVASALESAGYAVFGLSDAEAGTEANSLCIDLLDRTAVHSAVRDVRPDVVIHLAAVSFVAHDDIEQMYRVNILGTRNLLEALCEAPHQPQKTVLASSANVYGDTPGEPADEDREAAPRNDYAVSKLAMEHMARLWSNRLAIVVARPFNYIGAGQSLQFLVPKIVDHFRRGASEIALGNIDVVRDFSDVRDIARLYVQLVQHAPAGTTFNLCSGSVCSLRDVLALMQDIGGYRINVRVDSAFVRDNEVVRLAGDHTSLARLLGTYPQTPLASTLRWMYESAAG